MMDYFRRPVLAGNNLPRTRFAVIHGSKRRSDPDGTSLVPYFPGVGIGGTLNIKVDNTTYPVTLSGNGIATVISDINAAIGSVAYAFDADGSIGLSHKTQGSDHSIGVMSGTAADGLGFDLIANEAVGAYGGEFPSSPEARAGNWQGVVFPRKGENFSIDAVNRMTGVLAGNLDVLYSDLMRGNTRLQKVNTNPITGSGDGTATWTPTGSDAERRIFSGYGLLSGASEKEELAPFFVVIDRNTKQVAQSRVVAVTRGVPGVTPPPVGGYANTANWNAQDGGNVLGVDLSKVTGIVISEVRENRVVKCTGATFVTSKVRPGDFVEISGATNNYPYSHNGYRWVVEDVLDEEVLALRPMSSSELEQMGVVVKAVHPIVELNGQKSTGEVYGSLAVKTGTFCSHVTFVFDPPLPHNGSFDLYAAQSVGLREDSPFESQMTNDPLYRDLVSDLNPVSKGILSGLDVTISGTNATVNAGYVRWNGKEYYVPARTFSMAEIGNTVNRYFYWDKDDCIVKMIDKTSWSSSLNGIFLGSVSTSAGAFIDWQNGTRYIADAVRELTVGAGGQFVDLAAAFNFINTEVDAYSETVGYTDGAYPHYWDIVVLNDVYIPTNAVKAPGVRIRGGAVGVKLISDTGRSLYYDGVGQIVIEDIGIRGDSVANLPFLTLGANATARVAIKNVRQDEDITTQFDTVVSTAGGNLLDLLIERSKFCVRKGIVHATLGGSRLYVYDNQILRHTGGLGAYATPVMFAPEAGTGGFIPYRIFVERNDFGSNWGTTSDSFPLMIDYQGTGGLHVNQNDIGFTSFASNSDALFIKSTGLSHVHQNRLQTRIPRFFDGQVNQFSYVRENFIQCGAYATASVAIKCWSATNNRINVSGSGTGVVLQAENDASGNSVFGTGFGVGIQDFSAGTGVEFVGNFVQCNSSTVPVTYILASSSSPKIIGNNLRVLGGGSGSFGIYIDETVTFAVVSNNYASVGNASYFGISGNVAPGTFTGNYFESSVNAILAVFNDAAEWTISGNSLLTGSASTTVLAATTVSSGCKLVISGNRIKGNILPDATSAIFVSGNHIEGSVTPAGGEFSITDNKITGSVSVPVSAATRGVCSGNDIGSNVSGSIGSGGSLFFNENSAPNFSISSVATDGYLSLKGNRLSAVTFTSTGVNSSATVIVEGNLMDSFSGPPTVFTGNDVKGTFTVIDNLNVNVTNNKLRGDVTMNGSTSEKTFSGNYVAGTTVTLRLCEVTGCYFEQPSTTTFNFFDCCVSGTTIYGGSSSTLNATRCQFAGCYISALDILTEDCELSANEILTGTAATDGLQCTSGSVYLSLVGNRISNGRVTIPSTTSNVIIQGNYVSHTFNVTAGSTSKQVISGNNVNGATTISTTGGCRVTVVGNNFGTTVSCGPCIFDSNYVLGDFTQTGYISGSGLYFKASGCYFNGAVSQAADGFWSNCEINGAYNNNANLSFITFQGCKFNFTVDVIAETVNNFWADNCHFSGGADIGANSSGLSGGIQTITCTNCLFSNSVNFGIEQNAAPGAAMITGCRFTGTVRFASENAYDAYSISACHFQSFFYCVKGNFRFSNSLFRQGLQCAAVTNNDIRIQVANCTSYGSVQIARGYRCSVVGCYIDTAEASGGAAAGGSALILNGVDGCQIEGNWINTNGGTGCIYTNSGSTGRNCTWINIRGNMLQQNTNSSNNNVNCIRLADTNFAIIQGNFAYKATDGVNYPIWMAILNTSTFAYVGGNFADSGNTSWPCYVSNAGTNTYWFPESTATQDGFGFDWQRTYDGGIGTGATGIN
jgi:hypothetical protein